MLLAAGVVASVALLGACSSLTQQTPAQVAAKMCPLLNSEIGTLSQAGVFTGGAAVTLNETIAPAVSAACAAGATVTVANVQSISSAVAPLLVSVVKASGLPQSDQVTAVLAIGTIKGMIDVAFPPATVTAPAPITSGAVTVPMLPAAAPKQSSSMAAFHSGDVLSAEDLNRNFGLLNRRLETLEQQLRPVELSDSLLMVPAVNHVALPLAGAPL
ncbi:hypothetical protein [Burkholderia cepacia]|nr:hypothetical protein [Burkholderia cepacia]MDN7762968.1 hypothetical protein [Burkholderia cepacia]